VDLNASSGRFRVGGHGGALPIPFLVGYGNEFPLLIVNVIQFYNFDKYAFTGNVTKIIGRNSLKVGAELMFCLQCLYPKVLRFRTKNIDRRSDRSAKTP